MAESSQRKNKTVWFLVHRRELLDQTIKTFERFDIPLRTIHIGMITSYANHLYDYPKPDFIIFDEAHFSAANTWQKIITAFPDAYIVGLTATPCRLDGKPLGSTYDDMVVGITARELIDQGYLSPYKYYAPVVTDLSALKRKGSDYNQSQAAEILSQRAVFGDVIKHYRMYADGLQAICYCTTVKHSEEMAAEFRTAGINAVHFDGNTPADERTRIIEDYRSGVITILCNCDLISCGFDCPDCHCCILLRPTLSTALYIQQSMRALRPQEGKTAIILDHVNNYERHGLPDDPREWSLDETMKPADKYGEDGRLLVKQCLQCYCTYKAAPACPNCGYVNPTTAQELENIKAIRLEEIKQDRRVKAETTVRDKTLDDCHTLQEVMSWCKLNNKKPGYGYYYAKSRGLVR
jgi:superfamily II DNA or RNA helicase